MKLRGKRKEEEGGEKKKEFRGGPFYVIRRAYNTRLPIGRVRNERRIVKFLRNFVQSRRNKRRPEEFLPWGLTNLSIPVNGYREPSVILRILEFA